MNSFEINGNTYIAKEVTFADVLTFEANGVDMDNLDEKPMNAMVVYFAICAGVSKKAATAEIENHLINGGSFDQLYEAFSDSISNSGFFRKIKENQTKETPEGK